MIYRRYHIRVGARTTAGGTVRASSNYYILEGAPLAREGDVVDCPSCGAQGVIKCVTPRLSDSFGGKQNALSDDLCICKCNPPPKLVADQNIKCQTFALAAGPSASQAAPRGASAKPATSAAPSVIYDERPQLIASPIAGMPYYIETTDGRKFSGRTGADGLLPRIDTHSEDEYTVYWGDEALGKMEGAEA